MNLHKATYFLCAAIVSIACTSWTVNAKQTPDIKKSSSSICHDVNSRWYDRTKNYTAYLTLDECIKSGGRLYKGAKTQQQTALDEAEEQGRYFVSLYNRKDWPHWLDEDSDCQNLRHELLISTSKSKVTFKTNKQCLVFSGAWYDPFSDETYTVSTDLDLDHIVPLKFAHGRGGDKWPRAKKQRFANDVENLILVQASLNRQKGAKGPDEWLPPNHQFRCQYIAKFVAVMNKYTLSFIPSEQHIVNRQLEACNA